MEEEAGVEAEAVAGAETVARSNAVPGLTRSVAWRDRSSSSRHLILCQTLTKPLLPLIHIIYSGHLYINRKRRVHHCTVQKVLVLMNHSLNI